MTRRYGRRGEQDLAREVDDLRDAVMTGDEFRTVTRDPATGDLLDTTGDGEGEDEIVDPDALPADTQLIVIDDWLIMSRENAEKFDRTILEDVPEEKGVEGRDLVRVLPYEDYRDEWPRGSGSGSGEGSAGAGSPSTDGERR